MSEEIRTEKNIKQINIEIAENGKDVATITVPAGSLISDIRDKYIETVEAAKGVDPKTIVAATADRKLLELWKHINTSCRMEFVTVDSVMGFDMYKRSLILLMLKAFSSVLDIPEGDFQINVMYSLGQGFFCTLEFSHKNPEDERILDEAMLEKVKKEMHRLVEKDIKLEKKSIATDEVIADFRDRGMTDKAELFKYRRVSKTNIYNLEGYSDYFFGYMVPSTGYLTSFDLELYADGFVLILPDKKTGKVAPYKAPDKLYNILRKAEDWGAQLGVTNVGRLNNVIASGETNNLMLVQEAIMEKQIADIAEKVKEGEKKVVLIAGPSSSGKTTFSNRLSIQLQAHGLRPHPIAMDNFFKERCETPIDENGKYDFESLQAMDLDLFNKTMSELLEGKEVQMPEFDFVVGEKKFGKNVLRMHEDDVLVVEGIHALNPESTKSLPQHCNYKIYISALTQLNIDEHNRISTTDTRLLRRIVRDARTRGNDAQKTISMWQSVRAGEEKNIFPFQEEADIMFNSALIYELSAIKQFAEPLLFNVPSDSEEYYEAKRLLKFLDYFLGIDVQMVPQNSLLREFIGGGCFKV